MNKERVLETFLDMAAIDSPSCHEAAMAAYCRKRLETLGFTVRFDDSQAQTGSDTPQIIAFKKGTGAGRIALSAHMDCVQPCEGVKTHIEDGIIRSDGTTVLGGDDKSGVAEILEAVQSLGESGRPSPDITVLFSVCEEQGVAGAPYFPENLFEQETLCLVVDAEGHAGTIFTAAPHHYTFTATFHGRSAHAGVNPEDGINAIAIAARAIDRMPIGRHDESTTSSVGIIEGGSATNIVPDSCIVRGECRSLDLDRVERVRLEMDRVMREAAASFGGTVGIDWALSYPGFRIADEDPDMRMIVEIAGALGIAPRLDVTGGGSDANVLGAKGAKAIPIASGMTDFHSLEESLSVADLQDCALFIEEILARVGGGR
jgi:tripeptide aminopeptidase